MQNNIKSHGKEYLRQRRFNQQMMRAKSLFIHVLTVVFCLAVIAVCYYPIVKDVFALSDSEEPAIPEPVEVVVPELSKEVQIKVVTNWTQERIVEEIHKVFPDAPYMERVARCEGVVNGKLDPNAFNPTNNSNDQGIFQISEYWQGKHYRSHGFTDMSDPAQNIAFTRILFDIGGLSDWEASRHCWS